MTRARSISRLVSDQVTGNVNISGILTATTLFGEGSGITGVTAVGSGVTILDNGVNKGAASKIDFADHFTVSTISSGITTITIGITTEYIDSKQINNAGVVTTGSAIVGSAVTINSTGINVSGVITATTFVGSLTGTATSATNAANADNAANAANAAVATYATTAGISTTAQGLTGTPNINVGVLTAIEINISSSIEVLGFTTITEGGYSTVGVVTASSFRGDGSQLTGIGIGVTANVNTSTLVVAGMSTLSGNLSVSGVSTFAGITTVTGTTLFVKQLNTSGISTINELDVTNDISVGTRVEITGFTTITSNGLDVVGVVTAASFRGDASYTASGRWTLGANGTSDYTFTGIGFTQTTNDPLLYLARGRVYEFANNSGGAHPFEIRVSNGGAAYNDGVTNNAAAMGVIRFEIPFSAPNTLYYQCTNHSGMGNTITVYPSI
jgi:hypothetical protein